MRPRLVSAIVIGALVALPATADADTEDDLEALQKRAESLLAQSLRRVAETTHVVVVTDAIEPEVAELLAANLEGVFAACYRLLENKFPAPPSSRKLQAYLFSSESQYNRFVGHGRSEGAYAFPGLLAFHQERFTKPELRATMIHEGVHAYLEMCVAKPGRKLPVWIHEGLATYMERSVVESGTIQPGVFYRKERYDYHVASRIVDSMPLFEARHLNTRLKRGKMSVAEVVSAPLEAFKGEDGRTLYAASWALVHFLRHGRPDASAKFVALLSDVVDGVSIEDALHENYDLTTAALEGALKEYVNTALTHPPDNPPGSLRGQPAPK